MIKIYHKHKDEVGWGDLDHVEVTYDSVYGVDYRGHRVWINWTTEDMLVWALKREKNLVFLDEDGDI